MTYDLLIKDCRLVRPHAIVPCGIAVRGGRVAALLEPGESPAARRVIDAGGRHVIPGLIDTHVHFGNAGNPFEEDCRTESRAAATGGVTTMLVYVFGSGEPYDGVIPDHRRAVETHSLVDVMFHLGVTSPAYIPEVRRYAEQYGLRSFKAFMTWKHERGPASVQGLTDGELTDFFRQVAAIPGGIALVHCENAELIESAARPLRASGRQDLAAWSEARPIFGELESIRRALAFAQEAGVVRFVIPHVGIGLGSEFLREKRWGKVRLAVETCPHYLVFDQDQDLGVAAKVNPPLRKRDQVEALWDRLLDDTIDLVGSDQLAFRGAAKGTDIWPARGGLTGGMPMILPALLTDGVRRGRLPLTRLVELTSARPARIWGLYPRKGALEVGSDADMVILDEDRKVRVTPAVLNTASDTTAYEGYLAHGWAGVTIAGGRVVYKDGQVADEPGGVLLNHRPERAMVPA